METNELLFEVLENLTEDCKKVCAHELPRVVSHLIEMTVQESVMYACATEVQNADFTSRYSTNFRDLVDIELCTERAIRDVVSDKISLILQSYHCTTEQYLDDTYIKIRRQHKPS